MICIYARQSVDKKDSISIETQIDACKKQISALNLNDEITVFQDKGYSGSNTNRPGFEKLMAAVKNNTTSKIVVYKLDRISRSLLDFAHIIETLKKQNIDFISTQEQFDTSTPIGNAMLSIIMVFAQLERETIQLRIKDNYYARGRIGMYLGGPAPYGFIKAKTHLDGKQTYTLKINENNIETLKHIFDQYANTNKSLGSITKELNNKGVASPSGTVWDSCKLSRIMRNPVYVKADASIYVYYQNKGCILSNDITDFVNDNGCYLYGKREANERKYTDINNHTLSLALHEGVILSEIFLKCQRKLDQNKQIKRAGASTRTWLSGLAKCPYCGYAMTVTHSHKNIYKLYCSGRKNHIRCDREKLSYNINDAEEFIGRILNDYVANLKDIQVKDDPMPSQNEKNIRLYKIEEEINNLIKSLANGSETINKYINEKITKLDHEKEVILNEINSKNIFKENSEKILKFRDMISTWDELKLNEKKEIAKTFIDKILFYDDKVQVKFLEDT